MSIKKYQKYIIFIPSAFLFMLLSIDHCSAEPVEQRQPLFEYKQNAKPVENLFNFYYGPDLSHLYKTTFSGLRWRLEDQLIIGETAEVTAISPKILFPSDISISFTFAHPAHERFWAISLSAQTFGEGYTLICERNTLVLTKNHLDNCIASYDLNRLSKTSTTEIQFHKNESKISIYINKTLVLEIEDSIPPVTQGKTPVYLACIESKLMLADFQVFQQIPVYNNARIDQLHRTFNNSSYITYWDQYIQNRSLLEKKYKHLFSQKAIIAAYALGLYPVLKNAETLFPDIKDKTLLLFYRSLIDISDKKARIRKTALHMISRNRGDLFRDYIAALQIELLKNMEIPREKEFDRLFKKYMSISDLLPEFTIRFKLKVARYYALNDRKESAYALLESLFLTVGKNSDHYPKILTAYNDIALSLDDEQISDRLLNAVQSSNINIPFTVSWLYLKKGERLIMENNAAEGLVWIEKVINEFPNELSPWLWAQCSKAKLLLENPKGMGHLAEFYKKLSKSYPHYKKQSNILLSIVRRFEDSSSRNLFINKIKEKTGINKISASSNEKGLGGKYALFDNSLDSRWGSSHGKRKQWLQIEFIRPRDINGMKIFWEYAAAKKYTVSVTKDGNSWHNVFETNNGKPSEALSVRIFKKKIIAIRIDMSERTSQWGYSIRELVLF